MRLPVIDYDAHPGYRDFVGAVDADRAARVRRGHSAARAKIAAGVGTHLSREFVSRDTGGADTGGLAGLLAKHGVVPLGLDAEANSSMFRYLDERIEELKRSGQAWAQMELNLDLNDAGIGETGSISLELIRTFDLLNVARTQLGTDKLYAKVSLRYSTLENQAEDRSTIPDQPDPRTVGLHFDVPTNSVKFTLFLSEVEDLETGAFGYIPGSHLRDLNESLDRVATHVLCTQDWIKGPADFMALPNHLRQRATFGGDIVPESEMEASVLASERIITGPPGRCMIFDTLGAHRGGMVTRRARRALQIGFFDAAWGRQTATGML